MGDQEPTVGEAVLRFPKTLPADISVAQARACFAHDHVHMLLLTESERLLGTLVRSDLDGQPDGPALALARMEDRTISAQMPAEDARLLLLGRGQRRLAVVDTDDRLIGLLCLKRRLTGFCSDADVAARAADRTA